MDKRSNAKHNLVIKGNDFINARHQLSVAEMRIVLTMITQIGREDADFKLYRIHIKDFVDAIGTSHKGEYERAREITANLMKRVMEIPKERGYLQISFLSSAEYTKGTGYVELSFDPKLKPYLLQLKERFTQYDIRNVLSLQSFYSIRIYELLKQYIRIGERIMGVDELKEILQLPASYSHYASFKRRIILQSQKDLAQHTDLSFTFEELKTGRRITRVRFLIKGAAEAGEIPLELEEKLEQELEGFSSSLGDRLVSEFGLSHKQATEVLRTFSQAYIEENLKVVEKRLEKGTVKDPAPYTLKALSEDFRKTETVAERRHRKKLEAAEHKQRLEDVDRTKRERLFTEFEMARDAELIDLYVQVSLDVLTEGFSEYLAREHKFTLDFVRREATKQGRPFALNDYLEHALIMPPFKSFLATKYLPPSLKTFESWVDSKRP
jgi:plasmid replication initiation protein